MMYPIGAQFWGFRRPGVTSRGSCSTPQGGWLTCGYTPWPAETFPATTDPYRPFPGVVYPVCAQITAGLMAVYPEMADVYPAATWPLNARGPPHALSTRRP